MKLSPQFLDPRDATSPFLWPEYESKHGGSVSGQAPVTAFAEEVRTKVSHFHQFALILKVFNYFQGVARTRGVPLLEATKVTQVPE